MEATPTHGRATTPPHLGEAGAESLGGTRFFRRRRFLIDSRYQLRASLLTVTVVLILLFLLNLSLYSLNRRTTAEELAIAPELESYLLSQSQSRSELNLILIGSAIFLVGTFVVGVLETHRTAGAAYQIGRSMARICDGRFTVSLHLRRSDELQEVASVFNTMAMSLQERTRREIGALEEISARVRRLPADAATPRILDDLQGLLEQKRRLVE
jgi:methyl-accepting chemotaxis protein